MRVVLGIAAWCAPFIRDLPMVDRLKGKMSGSAEFAHISADEDRDARRAFLARRPMDGLRLSRHRRTERGAY